MSITNINTRRPPARSGDDSINNSILKLVADWKVLRAKQEIEWAQRELATSLGHDERVSLEFLDGMRHCEFVLCQLQPKNVMAARAMLGVAIAILAYEGVDPESVLANG